MKNKKLPLETRIKYIKIALGLRGKADVCEHILKEILYCNDLVDRLGGDATLKDILKD